MSPPKNNWRHKRTEHRFYAEIVIDIHTNNSGFLPSFWRPCLSDKNYKFDRISRTSANFF